MGSTPLVAGTEQPLALAVTAASLARSFVTHAHGGRRLLCLRERGIGRAPGTRRGRLGELGKRLIGSIRDELGADPVGGEVADRHAGGDHQQQEQVIDLALAAAAPTHHAVRAASRVSRISRLSRVAGSARAALSAFWKSASVKA